MAFFCDICAGDVPAGQDRCEDCRREVREQIARMGGKPVEAGRPEPVADKRLLVLLGEERLVGMVEDLVDIALRAREHHGVGRRDVSAVVKRLARAEGLVPTREALIELAAIALAFANRLPKERSLEQDIADAA